MTDSEHVDVVVVGAGISGIGAGYHLQDKCPDRTYVILEGREDLGGTWDLFRYPGVRSDSDMHTLGYSFKPWQGAKSIADGPDILAYLRETAAEYGIDRHIRFGQQVQRATWSSDDARWTVETTRTGSGEAATLTCNFLFMCSGYYSYKQGHQPEFVGRERFAGPVIHPQQWPEDLDYAGKRVVIIGSGATAVTLVPAMAAKAEHVTMLQRSPSYVVSRPARDVISDTLRKVLPERTAYAITRWKNAQLGELFYRKTRTDPDKVKAKLLAMVTKELGPDYDVGTHFTPSYNPWDQRLCLVPDANLFEAIRSGLADVVTGHIETFTESGITLTTGEELAADVIVTATGLELVTLGEMDFVVDGEPVDFSQTFTYKGLAYSDVPNLASSFGYINASWTLRADMTCDWVCRVLNHLRETGTSQVTPRLQAGDRAMAPRPYIDDFSSGYMRRAMPMLAKQGDHAPWINTQSYNRDKELILRSPVDDAALEYASPAPVPAEAPTDSAVLA